MPNFDSGVSANHGDNSLGVMPSSNPIFTAKT
jgi:hypothetical protein